MVFTPINPRNAIQEAVFVLRFTRPFLPPEADAIRALHQQFREDLPQLQVQAAVNIFLGPGGPPTPQPSPTVQMAAYQRDGSVETRLAADGPILVANFLHYTRWNNVWPRALGWFRGAVTALSEVSPPNAPGVPPLLVMACAHQVIDLFRWQGQPVDATAQGLFQGQPDRLPPAAMVARGAWQASHTTAEQLKITSDIPATLIDALTLDLSQEAGIGPRLKLEHMLEVRFNRTLGLTELFGSEAPQIDRIMNMLHSTNKSFLRKWLRPELLAQIGMDND